MTCDFGFPELANRNSFVKDLHDQGYDADFVGNYFVLYGLPYLDHGGSLQHGDLFSPVALGEEGVIEASGTHQVWWRGAKPHAQGGIELGIGIAAAKVQITPDRITDYAFSLKLLDDNQQRRDYRSFQEKIDTYLAVIVQPALAAYPNATPLCGIERRAIEQKSPLRLPDTSSANYQINDIANLLRDKKVAIVGLGGTGSYILDFIARTHLDNITLFDDDTVHVHTLFRFPGFVDSAIGKPKVEALAKQYDKWHSGIEAVIERISAENVERLRRFDFVFVSVDDGPSRRFIIDWLSAASVPYVDCGMGLNRSFDGLNGVVRITGVDRSAYEQTVDTRHLPTENPKDAEYRKQAQIAELNALNAALAVIRFKQHFKLYDRADESVCYLLETASFEIDGEGRKG
jgi:hypothetical protein